MSGEIYSDDVITLDDGGLTLSKYYFPLGSAKRIEYADIKGVAVETMNWATGKGRVWARPTPVLASAGQASAQEVHVAGLRRR